MVVAEGASCQEERWPGRGGRAGARAHSALAQATRAEPVTPSQVEAPERSCARARGAVPGSGSGRRSPADAPDALGPPSRPPLERSRPSPRPQDSSSLRQCGALIRGRARDWSAAEVPIVPAHPRQKPARDRESRAKRRRRPSRNRRAPVRPGQALPCGPQGRSRLIEAPPCGSPRRPRAAEPLPRDLPGLAQRGAAQGRRLP